MLDLQLSLAGMIILCLIAATGGAELQKKAAKGIVIASLAGVCGLMVVYLIWIWDRPLLSRILPFSGAIILGNWLPVIGSFFVGICIRTKRIAMARRMILAAMMAGLCGYSLARPLLGDAPHCLPLMHGQVLDFQTTDSTCSVACAAGLLRIHGISATEGELAELCLTRRGTHWLGVYRGLKLKTAGTEWDVVAEEIPAAELVRGRSPLGVLSLTFGPESAARAAESGFGTHMGHSVVSLGHCERPGLTVFDPSPDYGIESWDSAVLQDIEACILLRLVSRRGSPSPQFDLVAYRQPYWKNPRFAQRDELFARHGE